MLLEEECSDDESSLSFRNSVKLSYGYDSVLPASGPASIVRSSSKMSLLTFLVSRLACSLTLVSSITAPVSYIYVYFSPPFSSSRNFFSFSLRSVASLIMRSLALIDSSSCSITSKLQFRGVPISLSGCSVILSSLLKRKSGP